MMASVDKEGSGAVAWRVVKRIAWFLVGGLVACGCGEKQPPRAVNDGVVVVPTAPAEAEDDEDDDEPTAAPPQSVRGLAACNDNATAAGRAAARDLFQDALQDFERGDYAGATKKFEHAYEISCAAPVLYNIGSCYELMGDTDKAIAVFERYLASDPTPRNADEVRRRIEKLRDR